MLLSKKPIALGSLSTLVLGVALIAIPALSQGVFSLFVFAFGKDMDLLFYSNVMGNMAWINAVPPVIGGVLLCYVASCFIRSKFSVDTNRVKRQGLHVSSWLLIGLIAVGCFVSLSIPTSEAMNTATTGYILDTPVSDFDYFIGNYSNGNIYAINGSNWDNLVGGVGSSAWSAYTGNYTKIEELALQALSISGGKVLLKNVAFNLALMDSIPVNVTVVCSYGSQDYTYINPDSSVGSPYTVSVGQGMNCGYYTAEDAKGRVCFTSTNASNVINSGLTAIGATGKPLHLTQATYHLTAPIVCFDYTRIEGEGRTTVLKADVVMDRVIDARAASVVTIKNLKIEGDNKAVTGIDCGHGVQTYVNDVFENVQTIRTTNGFNVEYCDDIQWINPQINAVNGIVAFHAVGGLFRVYGGTIYGSAKAFDLGSGSDRVYLTDAGFFGGIILRDSDSYFLKNCYTEGANPSPGTFQASGGTASLSIDGGFYRTTTSGAYNIWGTYANVTVKDALLYSADTPNIIVTGKLSLLGFTNCDHGVNYVAGTQPMHSITNTLGVKVGTNAVTDFWYTPTISIAADTNYADFSQWTVPKGLTHIYSVSIVFYANANVTGMSLTVVCNFGGNGSAINAETSTASISQTVTANNRYVVPLASSLYADWSAGDVVSFKAIRNAGQTADAKVYAIVIEYT